MMLSVFKRHKKVSQVFETEPYMCGEKWGFRGDVDYWRYLRDYFKANDIDLRGKSALEIKKIEAYVVDCIYRIFYEKTGCELNQPFTPNEIKASEAIRTAAFAKTYSGLSRGLISPAWGHLVGIPLIRANLYR